MVRQLRILGAGLDQNQDMFVSVEFLDRTTPSPSSVSSGLSSVLDGTSA